MAVCQAVRPRNFHRDRISSTSCDSYSSFVDISTGGEALRPVKAEAPRYQAVPAFKDRDGQIGKFIYILLM